jgi:hypothetical protein
MRDFQRDLRARRLAARHKRETDAIDERMKEVRKLPKGFEVWVNETVLNFSRYIYYKRESKRLISGFCTSCDSQVEFRVTNATDGGHVRHNERGQCPVCGKAVTFKAMGRTTRQVDTATAALAQKTKTGFIVRIFEVTKEYKSHYREPKLYIRELVRDFYDGREIVSYEYADFRHTGKIRWRKSLGKFKLDIACLYFRNVRRVLADSEWRYSGLWELARNVDKFNVYGYLSAYINYPAYEYLVKLGLYRFVAENVRYGSQNNTGLNFAGRNFQEVLGIDRVALRQMQRLNGTLEHYKLIKAAGGVGVTLKDEQAETLTQMRIDPARLAELLKFAAPQKAIGYIGQCLEKWEPAAGRNTFRSLEGDIAGFWGDYLTNCALLGYDMKDDFILYPRDLKARHDEAAALVRTNRAALLDKAIAAMAEALQNRYGFAWKGLIVRAPVSAAEIIAEGHALRHCAGTGAYIENMAKGQGCILFIRRIERPYDPFFTMEIRDEMVIQCRGANNCGMADDVRKFVAEFQRKKLRRREGQGQRA